MQSTLQLKPLPADDDDVPPEEEEEELVLSGSDDGDDDAPAKPARQGRRKIKIEYIHDKSRRHITFSKRKAGIMKKVGFISRAQREFRKLAAACGSSLSKSSSDRLYVSQYHLFNIIGIE